MSCVAEYANTNMSPQSITSEFQTQSNQLSQTYSVGAYFRILMLKYPGLGTRDINDTINNSMRDMYTLRPKLTSK